MYPAPFRYHRPANLKEAILMLSTLGETAKPLAGGQTLIPILKLRMDEPTDLVDIGRLPDLRFAKNEGGWVEIGALSPHGWVARSDIAMRQNSDQVMPNARKNKPANGISTTTLK